MLRRLGKIEYRLKQPSYRTAFVYYTSECRGDKQRMYLKYNRDEITWIDPQYLTKEVAQDICGFWLDTDRDKLCTARWEKDGSIAHYWFDKNTNQWTFLKSCS